MMTNKDRAARRALLAELRGYATVVEDTKLESLPNINKSMEGYYSRSSFLGRDKLLQASTAYWASEVSTAVVTLPEREVTDRCQICYEFFAESKLNRRCQTGGVFCRDCIVSFLEAEIRVAHVQEEGCECVCRSCANFFSEDMIRDLVSADIVAKFVQFRDAKLVLENPLKVYCPNRYCSKVVTISEWASRGKCNDCHTSFCTKCSGEHSSFITCDWAADSEFKEWKRKTESGCKRCPGCSMFIEKNGGCNHMTCNRCNHQFCWKCTSPWTSGCSAKKLCFPLTILRHDRWGSTPVVREATQVVGITAGVGVGIGVLGVGVGLAAGAACVAAGLAAPVVAVGGSIYVIGKTIKGLKKRHMRKKRQRMHGYTISDDDIGELADELKWGIRVYLPHASTDPIHREKFNRDETSYMGMAGRVVEDIFIAYPNMGGRLYSISPALFIIPSNITLEVVERVAGWTMAETSELSISASSSEKLMLDFIGDEIQNRYYLCSTDIGIPFRRLPQQRPPQNSKYKNERPSFDNANLYPIFELDADENEGSEPLSEYLDRALSEMILAEIDS